MTREERELSITYLEGIKEKYIEGEGYERHPLPEYYAIEMSIKALKQEPMVEIDLYSVIKQKYIEREVLDKIRAEIEKQEKWLLQAGYNTYNVDIAFNSIKRALAESEDKG